ncbi:MAG: helix-turn-helix domain-containing protein [Methanobrevibacter sp.]|jgi:putative transposase|nr:helix-turn-helix domain-containing protein [Candidatus Methanovirga basalitermitum]
MLTKTKLKNKSYKYRIYPSFEQEEYLFNNIDCSRFVFNGVKEFYEHDRDLIKQLTNSPKINYFLNRKNAKMYLKHLKERFDFLNDVDSIALQKAYE